ncbi:hypothetical protein CKO28_14290 [Rhodovibrio sodomensis]|uniref:Exonuclease domain-containing protein n=1 Tax=Rhodovibrio sodomensis TaxID=1088 RepID=A0ABS1DHI5_9PROT|nr:hypothetical protein [Rhodovibrio sodomensis]MBK1669203.1 hypothetical protein [Rhodovibrio sodomensis]
MAIIWPPDLTPLAFVDLEASGLGPCSYAIEIGWALVGPDLSVTSDSRLIRPDEYLKRYGQWEPEAERVHGIEWATLEREGVDRAAAVTAYLDAVDGAKMVLSDAPATDAQWISELLECLPAPRATPGLRHVSEVFSADVVGPSGAWHYDSVARGAAKAHRAEADARYWAERWVAAIP